jgi:hypothetical protein
VNTNNYTSNVCLENFNSANFQQTPKNRAKRSSLDLQISNQFPNLGKIEKSEKIKSLNERDYFNSQKNPYFRMNTPDNINKKSQVILSNCVDRSKITIRRNNSYQNNNDSKIFNTTHLSNENFNFNFIESKTTKEIKKFESHIKNNDSSAIIFGYINILKNFFSKTNEINILDFYPNLNWVFSEIILGINILIKIFIILLLILFNIFLFKCDFFLRFNMYLILINDTRSVIERGEINFIVANIKRWFAFISIVILDELIKFLYFPNIIINVWTCLMTIYLLLLSGPESGVQFIIINIYKILRKLNLFY